MSDFKILSCWAAEAENLSPSGVVGGAVARLPSGELATFYFTGTDCPKDKVNDWYEHFEQEEWRIYAISDNFVVESVGNNYDEVPYWQNDTKREMEDYCGIDFRVIYKMLESAVNFARKQNRARSAKAVGFYPTVIKPWSSNLEVLSYGLKTLQYGNPKIAGFAGFAGMKITSGEKYDSTIHVRFCGRYIAETYNYKVERITVFTTPHVYDFCVFEANYDNGEIEEMQNISNCDCSEMQDFLHVSLQEISANIESVMDLCISAQIGSNIS